MKVLKFGGGCLRDAAGFGRAAALAAAESPRPAVVVSAVGGVTDLLLSAVAAAAADGADGADGDAAGDAQRSSEPELGEVEKERRVDAADMFEFS